MKNSEIEWTDHTFNVVWGCTNVSPGCVNCYAHTLSKRWGFDIWGKKKGRRIMSEAYWKNPGKWNADAERAGKPALVFCSSMADVFEDHPDNQSQRPRLFKLIDETPWLVWQLLTKRPENIMKMVPLSWKSVFPKNVWIGTTTENQKMADKRIPILIEIPAVVRFISGEPLLEEVSIPYLDKLQWVIGGGESGHSSRRMSPDWARSLRNQCVSEKVPFFFKQWGQFNSDGEQVGKGKAGSMLDGKAWKQFPKY